MTFRWSGDICLLTTKLRSKILSPDYHSFLRLEKFLNKLIF